MFSGLRGKDLRMIIKQYLSLVHLCPSGKAYFLEGIQSYFKDIEDAFQYFHGLPTECDHIITSNVRDFEPHCRDMQVFSPSQFITQVLNKKRGIDF